MEKKGYLYSMHKGEIEEIPIMYWDKPARKIWRSMKNRMMNVRSLEEKPRLFNIPIDPGVVYRIFVWYEEPNMNKAIDDFIKYYSKRKGELYLEIERFNELIHRLKEKRNG